MEIKINSVRVSNITRGGLLKGGGMVFIQNCTDLVEEILTESGAGNREIRVATHRQRRRSYEDI